MRPRKRYLSLLSCCSIASATPARAAATPLTVITGEATDIDAFHARLGLQVVPGADGVTECGVCWGPSATDFVTQTAYPWRQRCMRQIPCLGNAYFTNDGYMRQREYAAGETYRYKAYAIDGAGRVAYGEDRVFTVPWLSTARCGDALALREVRLASTSLSKSGSSLPFEATVCNPTPSIAERVSILTRIEQGTIVADGGGTFANCWFTGNARPGLCPTAFVVDGHIDPALVPGPATLVVYLYEGGDLLSTYRTAITVEP
jgi:hypothetical protein